MYPIPPLKPLAVYPPSLPTRQLGINIKASLTNQSPKRNECSRPCFIWPPFTPGQPAKNSECGRLSMFGAFADSFLHCTEGSLRLPTAFHSQPHPQPHPCQPMTFQPPSGPPGPSLLLAPSTRTGQQPLAAGMPFVSQILRTDGHSQEVPVLQRPQELTGLGYTSCRQFLIISIMGGGGQLR